MKQTVKCGVLTSVLKTLGLLSSEFVNGINKLFELGIQAKDAKEEDTPNGKRYTITFDVPEVDVEGMIVVFEPKGDNKYDVSYEYKSKGASESANGKADNIKLASENDIKSYIAKIVEDEFGFGSDKISNYSENIQESANIQIKLKKVSASNGYEIHMTGINCGTDVSRVNNIIDTLMNDDEFISSIPETEQAYEVQEAENSIEVDPIDCLDIAKSISDGDFCRLLSAAKALREDLQYIHWNSKGENFSELYNCTDQYIWTLDSHINLFAEWSVEYYGEVPHLATLDYETSILSSSSGFTAEEGLAIVRQRLKDYTALIELYYCNFDSDIQNVLDDIIRELKKNADYFLARKLLR